MINKIKEYISFSKNINSETDLYFNDNKVYTYNPEIPIQIVSDFSDDGKAKKWDYSNSTFRLNRLDFELLAKELTKSDKEVTESIVDNNQFIYNYANGTKSFKSNDWTLDDDKQMKLIKNTFDEFFNIYNSKEKEYRKVFECTLTEDQVNEYLEIKKGMFFCNLKDNTVNFKNNYNLDNNHVLIKLHPNYIKTVGCTSFTISLNNYNEFSYLCTFHVINKKIDNYYFGFTVKQ